MEKEEKKSDTNIRISQQYQQLTSSTKNLSYTP